MNEHAVIINCTQATGHCPATWGSLCQTGDRMIRQCMACMHTVYYTDSTADADCRSAMGQRVALSTGIKSGSDNNLT